MAETILQKREDKEIIDQRESKKQKKEVKKKIKVNSKNREKERIKVAKIHRKIVNQRKDFNHNVSRTLVDNFDLRKIKKNKRSHHKQLYHYNYML